MPRHETELWAAADALAPLLADGRMSWESVRHVVALMAEGDSGATARLCWRVADAADDIQQQRRQMDQGVIRRACRALLATGQKADADRLALLLDVP